jgi:hypothetical protein
LKQISTSPTETCLKGQRSGLLALFILIHFTIYSVAYLGEVLTDPLTKKQSLITTIMEVFSSIPREDLKRACSRFRPRLEEVDIAKMQFHPLTVKSNYK